MYRGLEAKRLVALAGINSDPHSVHRFHSLRYGVGQTSRGWLEEGDMLNTHTLNQLMAYSFYPCVGPDRLTIYEAASVPESLFIILNGTCFGLPAIVADTALAYRIFRGNSGPDLRLTG